MSQEAKGPQRLPQSLALQKYSPPEVGYAEQISAIDSPTTSVNIPTTGHPYTIVIVPPYVRPIPNVVLRPVRTETMEKVTEKFAIALTHHNAHHKTQDQNPN